MKKILLINLLVLFAFLALVELYWQVNSSEKVLFSQDYRQTILGIQPEITYTLYDLGYRSVDYIDFTNKSKNTIRIACIGASTTDQPVQNNEDTWCALIGKKLQARFPDKKIQTASFAHAGWMSVDNLIWAEKFLADLQIDISISLFGINDIMWNGYEGYSYSSLEHRKQEISEFRRSTGGSNYPNPGYMYLKDTDDGCLGIILCRKIKAAYISYKKPQTTNHKPKKRA